MSNPLTKPELHDQVDEYCNNWCGNSMDIPYLHEMIDHPEKRKEMNLWDEFMEWIKG